MIVRFNPDIFYLDDKYVQKDILRLLLDFYDDKFLWELENLMDVFDDEEKFFTKTKTSKLLTDSLREDLQYTFSIIFQKSAYISSEQLFYFKTITIGTAKNEISPKDALRIINSPSAIFLENGENDWNFIKGLINNYANCSKKKNIYNQIKIASEKHKLIPISVGGGGEFPKVILSKIESTYQNIEKLKLMVIFDSDRNDSKNVNHHKWKALVSLLKHKNSDKLSYPEDWEYNNNDLISWHMLYKREMENYIPADLLLKYIEDIGDEGVKEITNLTAHEYDFFNFDKYLEKHKNDTPKIFLNTPIRSQLEQRCEHHKVKVEIPSGILEDIVEIEKIMRMIAKIL